MKEKKNRRAGKRMKFNRPDDPWWNPDNEDEYREAYGETDEETENSTPPVVVNRVYVQAFVDEYQPERDERMPGVLALSLGELRDKMQLYRTFDSKAPDPLPFYLEELACHGFGVRMGFGGEMVMLVSHRNNGKGMKVEEETSVEEM